MLQLSRDDLVLAYTRMRTIREFEENIHRENTTGEIPGFLHLYCGQEANAVAVCMQLEDTDYIASNHRGHGHCLAKGADVKGMMLELYGKEDGLCHGRGGSMHIADVSKGILGANGIVGAGAPLATGAALTAKTLGTGGVAVSFQGDGASNEGYVFEAINMAAGGQDRRHRFLRGLRGLRRGAEACAGRQGTVGYRGRGGPLLRPLRG